MKKTIGIILALLLVVSMAACSEKPADNNATTGATGAPTTAPTTVPTGTPTGTPTSTPTGAPTSEPTTAPTTAPTIPVADPKGEVLHRDTTYEFTWKETDGAKGVLTVAEKLTATAEEMAGLGLSGALTYKPKVLTYAVTYTKDTNGVYVAEGAITSAALTVEGESAAAFIQKMKETLDDSKLDILTGKVLDGEVLTSKEDIENYIWEFDTKVKLTFTVKDGKLTVTEYEKNYTSWGFQAPTKEVCHVENAVVRSYDEYERDALVRISEYRANGVIEKTDYYFEGKVSNTTLYDEKGKEIE